MVAVATLNASLRSFLAKGIERNCNIDVQLGGSGLSPPPSIISPYT